MSPESRLNLLATEHDFLERFDSQTADCFHGIQWNELCRIASGLACHLECMVLDQVASGLNNIVRVLKFSNQIRWAAWVHIRGTPLTLLAAPSSNPKLQQ